MAFSNEKRIIIQLVGENYKPVENQPTRTLDGSNSDVQQTSKMSKQIDVAKKFGGMVAINLKATALRAANISASRYFSLTENYIAENDLQNFKNVTGGLLRVGTSIATNAWAGMKIGGAYGAAAGAIIGAATWIVNEELNYQQKMSNYYQNLNATRYQTEFDRTRAGLVNEGKGTEN